MTRELTSLMSVGQIAAAYPELIPELERLGVDYCCGGDRSLGIAVSSAGHDVADVIHSLASYRHDAAGGDAIVDCASMSMTELADHIESTHHVFARESLARLQVLLEKCVIAHAEREPRLLELRTVVVSLAEDMHDHLVREERVLFPWLRRLERRSEIQSGPPWSVRRPIDCMIHDHDDVGAAFARIRELTDDLNPPEGACATWRECYRLLADLERDTHLHIHKENNVLFPAGIAAESALSRASGVPHPAGRDARGGFTLIELLIMIAIIPLLLGTSLPAARSPTAAELTNATPNTRDAGEPASHDLPLDHPNSIHVRHARILTADTPRAATPSPLTRTDAELQLCSTR